MNRNRRLQERLSRLDALLAGEASGQPTEMKVVRFRSHGRYLAVAAVILIAACGVGGFAVGTFPEAWQNLLLLAGLLLAILLLVVVPFLQWLSRTTIISTRRVIHRSGLVTRHRREILLARIRETRVKRGIWQRLFGAGDILLMTGVHEHLVLRNVPRVTEMSQVIIDLIELQFPAHRLAYEPEEPWLAQ